MVGKLVWHVGLPRSGLARVRRYGYVGLLRPGPFRFNPYIGTLPLFGGCPPTLVPEAGAVLQPRMEGHGRFTRKPASLADHRHNVCRRDLHVGMHFTSHLDNSPCVGSLRLAGKNPLTLPSRRFLYVAEHLCLTPRFLRTDGRATGTHATCVTPVASVTVHTQALKCGRTAPLASPRVSPDLVRRAAPLFPCGPSWGRSCAS